MPRLSRSTENVTICNCYVTGAYQLGTLLDGTFQRFDQTTRVSRNGRIKLGTESNGGFKNIAISNCVFEGCHGWRWRPSMADCLKTSASRT